MYSKEPTFLNVFPMKHQSHLLDCHSKTLKALQGNWVGGCGGSSVFSYPPESLQCPVSQQRSQGVLQQEVCLSLPHPVFLNICTQRTCPEDATQGCSSALRFYNINLGKLSSEVRWPRCSWRKRVGSEVVYIKEGTGVSRKQQDEGTAVMGI